MRVPKLLARFRLDILGTKRLPLRVLEDSLRCLEKWFESGVAPGCQSLATSLYVVSIPPLRSPTNYFGNSPAFSLERRDFLIKRLIAA